MVIVLGAGASNEAGLPLGTELKKKISGLLTFNFDGIRTTTGSIKVFSAIRSLCQDSKSLNQHLTACDLISSAMPQAISIDNFIDAHQGDSSVETCGKLAIVDAILSAEMHCRLYVRDGQTKPDFSILETTWYNSFFQLLTENCRIGGLEHRLKKVAFIVFNYDRCLEHYLYHAIRNYYNISFNEAASLVNSISIYHPYGTVGSLPWKGSDHMVDFGGEVTYNQLINLASQIKTFTEGTDQYSSDITSIRTSIFNANKILFLGFAYHKQNINLVFNGYDNKLMRNRIYGTAKGISNSNCDAIKSDISHICRYIPENIIIRNDLKCEELLNEYGRSLSIG